MEADLSPGGPFVTAVPALDLLGLALLANLGARHYMQVVVSRGLLTTGFRLSAISAAIHIAAKMLLARFWGITGAALGMLLDETILMLPERHAVRKELWRIA